MAAVSGIVNYDGKVLIGKKKSNSPKFLAGCWHIPGETIEGDETDEEALIRGFRQEASLEIQVGKYICPSITPSSKKEIRWYECYSKTDEVYPGSDLEEVKFVPRNEIINYCDKKAIMLWPPEVRNYFE